MVEWIISLRGLHQLFVPEQKHWPPIDYGDSIMVAEVQKDEEALFRSTMLRHSPFSCLETAQTIVLTSSLRKLLF